MKTQSPFLLLVTVAILAIAFSSFIKDDNQRFPGYMPLENGSYFLLHTKGFGTTVVDSGGAVFVKMKYITEADSVFMDINYLTRIVSLAMRINKPAFPGDFLDIFCSLHTGDSAVFFVRLDSLHKYYPNEFKFPGKLKRYERMEYLGFAVKVDSVFTKEKLTAYNLRQSELQKKYNDSLAAVEPAILKKYIADSNIKVKPAPDGLYFIETKKGEGPNIKDGQKVKLIYTGKFLDGIVFDSNPLTNPWEFILGKDLIIPGFEEGLRLMKKGGVATFIVPSNLAYNDGAGRIRPYATLVFDVEILDVTDPAKQ